VLALKRASCRQYVAAVNDVLGTTGA